VITLFFIKLFVTISVVLLLSLLAEYLSPKVSGIISGVPLGVGIILFFYGVENGPSFAAQSALSTLTGMVSMQVFITLYYFTSKKKGISAILVSSLCATLGYCVVTVFLRMFHFTILTGCAIPIVSTLLITFLFRKIDNLLITDRVRLGLSTLLFRALVASAMIIIITAIARNIGPQWAGLLSPFPVTLFPLILIIHSTYNEKYVHTIIKNVPGGQWAMMMYIVGVYLSYPRIGIYWGTLLCYSLVIVYLIGFFALFRKRVPA
jgi:hypothetical protein